MSMSNPVTVETPATARTRIEKNMRGDWEARSIIDIGNCRVFEMVTSKRFNGLICTSVKVSKIYGMFQTFRPFSDYNKIIGSSKARCTEKAVAYIHNAALSHMETYMAEAIAFYEVPANCE